MNERFNEQLKNSGLSVYSLSRTSGIPYTTVSEIKNCKTSINKCSLQTVYRLAASLGVKPEEITDEILYLDGCKGIYNGIHYIWNCDKTTKLKFSYDKEDVVIDFGVLYNIPMRIPLYNIIAGWRIQEYIDAQKWKKRAYEIWEKRNGK